MEKEKNETLGSKLKTGWQFRLSPGLFKVAVCGWAILTALGVTSTWYVEHDVLKTTSNDRQIEITEVHPALWKWENEPNHPIDSYLSLMGWNYAPWCYTVKATMPDGQEFTFVDLHRNGTLDFMESCNAPYNYSYDDEEGVSYISGESGEPIINYDREFLEDLLGSEGYEIPSDSLFNKWLLPISPTERP